jgi:hypothetical protein
VAGFFDAVAHAYYWDSPAGRDQWPSVTGIITRAGRIDTRWFTEDAAARGRAVHRVCELIDRQRFGTLGAADADMQINAWRALYPALLGAEHGYRLFVKAVPTEWTAIEQPSFHETKKYGGRPDRRGLVYGEPAVVELKTGQAADWHGEQLAGYQGLEPTGARFVVYLRLNGTYRIERCKDAFDYSRFDEDRRQVWATW